MEEEAEITTDLEDLAGVSLAEASELVLDTDATQTLRRVAPTDGTNLLVAASFNSAI